jgi:hypothetical protein
MNEGLAGHRIPRHSCNSKYSSAKLIAGATIQPDRRRGAPGADRRQGNPQPTWPRCMASPLTRARHADARAGNGPCRQGRAHPRRFRRPGAACSGRRRVAHERACRPGLQLPVGHDRRIDRLVDEGLVTRANSDADGRGVVVGLTEAGLARLAEAAPVHLRRVSELFVEKLSEQELVALASALRKVALDCMFG